MIQKALISFSKNIKETRNSNNFHIASRVLAQAMAHEAMIQADGNASKAAEKMGVTRQSFNKYLGMGAREWWVKYG